MHWLSHTKLSGAQMSQKTSWSSRKIDVENKVYVEFWDVKEKIQYSNNLDKQ